MWLLAKKELRLQQMTFVVAGLYHLLWVMAATFRHSVPAVPDTIAAAGFLTMGIALWAAVTVVI